MFKHILIPTDGSDLSRKALLHGVQLAKVTQAKVTVLTVRPSYVPSALDPIGSIDTQARFEEGSRALAEEALEQAEMAAQAAGVKIETLQEAHGQPYRAIVDCANANGCDLIVMGSHGRSGLSALLMGSETNEVLTHSQVPVLVYR